jgi:hypothetical protein
LFEDLARELLVVARRALGRIRVDFRAVDRDDADAYQSGLGAQPQHLTEEIAQRALVADPKARDRGVIGRLVGRDHPERDVLAAPSLDPARGALADRIRVHDQRHHHRRIMRGSAVPVGAIGGKERGQLKLADRVDHKPRKVVLGQPFAQTRRQQQLLLAITREEVLRHADIVLTDPDGTHHVPPATMKRPVDRRDQLAVQSEALRGRNGLTPACRMTVSGRLHACDT